METGSLNWDLPLDAYSFGALLCYVGICTHLLAKHATLRLEMQVQAWQSHWIFARFVRFVDSTLDL